MSRGCCNQTAPSICPCEGLVHPRVINNAAGMGNIAYRVGDYLSFREAMLRRRDGETQLTRLARGPGGTTIVTPLWRPSTRDVTVRVGTAPPRASIRVRNSAIFMPVRSTTFNPAVAAGISSFQWR